MGLSSSFRLPIAFVASLLASIVACDDLPDISANECGNTLVEPAAREACDGFATEPSASGLATSCGKPGTLFQCQYIHDAEHACPVGYGAGSDGLCRRGTALFSESISHTPATGTISSVADFDGDGRIDLLTYTPLEPEAKVTFLGARAQPRATSPIAVARSVHPPSFGRLGADAAADVVVADVRGLLVLRGRADATFEAKGYAPFEIETPILPIAIPAAAFVNPLQSAGYAGTYVTGSIAELDSGLVLSAGYQDALVVATIPDATLADVIGVVTMDIDPPPPFLPGSDEIVVVLGGRGNPGRVVAITPHLAPVNRRVFSFDADGALLSGPFKVDSRIGIGTGSNDPPYERYATLLSLDATGDALVATEMYIGQEDPQQMTPVAMGSYNLNGIRIPFVLLPNQIVVQGLCTGAPPGCFQTVAKNEGFFPWTTAAFDEAGGVVVAGSSYGTGLDVLLYNPGSTFLNAARLTTDAPVRSIDAGNFDGDASIDFLIRTRVGEPSCEDGTRLFVAWGDLSGFPAQPQAVGDLPGLESIAPANFVTLEQVDSISDFVVTTRCDDELRIGVFFGNASRQLQAPFPLPPPLPPHYLPVDNLGAVPMHLHDVGSADGGPADGIDDVLALVGYPSSIGVRAVFAGADADLQLGTELWPVTTIDDPVGQVTALSTGRMLSADMDADGDLDVVLVMSEAEHLGQGEATYRPRIWVGISDGGALEFSERGSAKDGFLWVVGEETGEISDASAYFSAATLVTQIALADLDGDGLRDLIIRTSTLSVDGVGPSESSLFSFLATSDGDFVEQALELPEGKVARGVASVEGGVPGMALAIASDDDVLLCGSVDGAFTCRSTGIEADAPNIGITAGDFDTDGVIDLAVARPDGIDFYRQLTEQDGVAGAE